MNIGGKSVEDIHAGFAAEYARGEVTDHGSKKSDPRFQIPGAEKLEEEIKSHFYELRKGKIWFSEEIKREHRRLKTSLVRYVLHSRFFAIVTAPFIYACIIPFALLDLFVSTYQAVCFPCLRHTESAAQGLHGD